MTKIVVVGNFGLDAFEIAKQARDAGYIAFCCVPSGYHFSSRPELVGVGFSTRQAIFEQSEEFADIWKLDQSRSLQFDWFVSGPEYWAALRLSALVAGDDMGQRRTADVLSLFHLKAVVGRTQAPESLIWSPEDLESALADRNVSPTERETFERGLAFDHFVRAFRAAAYKIYDPEIIDPLKAPFPSWMIDSYATLDQDFADMVRTLRADGSLHDFGLEAAPAPIEYASTAETEPLLAAHGLALPFFDSAFANADYVVAHGSACLFPHLLGYSFLQYDPKPLWQIPAESKIYGNAFEVAFRSALVVFPSGSKSSRSTPPASSEPSPAQYVNRKAAKELIQSIKKHSAAQRKISKKVPPPVHAFNLLARARRSPLQKSQACPPLQTGAFAPGAAILHLTNVANNAYLNATLLWERGYPSYVAHPDMYHFGSQPEWFTFDSDHFNRDDLGDHFFSNWWKLPPETRTRPRWFAEGPQHLVARYLRYLRAGWDDWADQSWDALEYNRLKAVTEKTTTPQSICWSESRLEEVMETLLLTDKEREAFRAQRLADDIVLELRQGARFVAGAANPDFAPPFAKGFFESFFAFSSDFEKKIHDLRLSGFTFTAGLENEPFLDRMRLRKPKMVRPEDFHPYSSVLPMWRSTFEHFDTVMAYGAGPNLCYLSGYTPYAAYEHGTIRSLPFVDDTQGRLLSKSYPAAHSVFITNNDYVMNEQRLEFKDEQRYYVPHVFDERPLLQFEKAEGGRKMQATPVRFFAPARQDWKELSPNTKGNHLMIEAIAMVARDRRDFEVTFVDWGPDRDASKAMIRELGLEDLVRWIEPVPKKQLWRYYLTFNALIDQLWTSSMSGVVFEAMTLKIRCITRDNGTNKIFFGEAPPLLSASTASSTADRMREVLADPLDNQGIGEAGLRWILKHHSHERFLEAELDAFSKMRATRENAVLQRFYEKARSGFDDFLFELRFKR